jgi:hypothetical protein
MGLRLPGSWKNWQIGVTALYVLVLIRIGLRVNFTKSFAIVLS